MAAQTITLDTLSPGAIQITRDGVDDAILTFTYTVSTSVRTFAQTRSFIPTLTPTQQTQVNNIWDALVNKAKNTEGL